MAKKRNITIKDIQTVIENYTRKSGISNERGLDVFLDYLIEMFDISSYKQGEEGRIEHLNRMKAKSIELFSASIGWLVLTDRMIQTGGWWDSLGTLYEEMYQSKGKASGLGQFFTPAGVCDIMALTVDERKTNSVNDPACGSGRTLLAMSAQLKASEKKLFDKTYYIGQDIDIMSVKMCAINMMIHNMRGRAVRTDTLNDPNHYDIGWEINEANYPFPCGAYSLRRIYYTEEDERKQSKKQFLIKSDIIGV